MFARGLDSSIMCQTHLAWQSMLPFRQLLKHDAPFIWTNELNDIFQESKTAIISEIEKRCADL